jgi:hypothetical protein
MTNKYIFFGEEKVISDYLINREVKFSTLQNRKLALSDFPVLFFSEPFDKVVINKKDFNLNFFKLIKNQYPNSKFFIEMSEEDPITYRKKLFSIICDTKITDFNIYLLMSLVESFNIKNKFSLGDFNSEDVKFFNSKNPLFLNSI